MMRFHNILLMTSLVACVGIADATDRYRSSSNDASATRVSETCRDCGTVERIEPVDARRHRRGNTVLRAVGGALGDIALDHINDDVATVADAARDAATEDSDADEDDGQDYDITVRMNDGRRRVIRQHELPDRIREGTRVRVSGDRIVVAR